MFDIPEIFNLSRQCNGWKHLAKGGFHHGNMVAIFPFQTAAQLSQWIPVEAKGNLNDFLPVEVSLLCSVS